MAKLETTASKVPKALTVTERPDDLLAAFFASTYATAELSGWDRTSLECSQPNGPRWGADRPHRT